MGLYRFVMMFFLLSRMLLKSLVGWFVNWRLWCMMIFFVIVVEFIIMYGVLFMCRYMRLLCLSVNVWSVLYGKGFRLNKLLIMGYVNGFGGRFFCC